MPYKALTVRARKGGFSKKLEALKSRKAAHATNHVPAIRGVRNPDYVKADKAVRRYEGLRDSKVKDLKSKAKRVGLAVGGGAVVAEASRH